jgi:hypothetical protein
MTYALIVPPEFLAQLVAIREATGVSIRQQILKATAAWIQANGRSLQAADALKGDKEVKP